MSWLPRVPSLGRFSPFSGTPRQHPSSPAARVTDDDFSYITSEDIQNHTQAQNSSSPHDHDHQHSHHHHHAHHDYDRHQRENPRHSEPNILHKTPSYPQVSSSHLAPTPHHTIDGSRPRSHSRAHSRSREPSVNREKIDRPSRDTDCLYFRHKGQILPVHFAAYAIDDGNVTVGSAREHAARRLDVHDPRRIRMFWRGQNLKDDGETLRSLGVKSSEKTEMMVVVGQGDRDDDSNDSSEDEDSTVDGSADAGGSSGRRKKRRGGGKKKGKKKSSSGSASPAPAYSGGGGAAEHLPVPSGMHPLHKASSTPAQPHGTSQGSSRQPSPAPTTPLGKLQALEEKFRVEFQPMCENLIKDPPREKEKRDYEYKKVTETIMTQVLLKVDGVETEGDEEARARRKALVKEVQGWLSKVDEVVKK